MSRYMIQSFCTLCDVIHEVEVSIRQEEIVIRDSPITYDRKSYYCNLNDKFFVTDDLVDENIEAALEQYNNIFQSSYIGEGLHLLRYL